MARAEVAHIFTRCWEMGHVPSKWKVAMLMLIRKPGEPLDLPSFYRPLSLINTTAKLFESVIKGRLEAYFRSISEHQNGFRKERSTIDAIQVTVIVQRVGTGLLAARDLLCVLYAIDIANAFNSALWHKIEAALIEKGVPAYLVNVIRNYLNNRRLLTEIGDMPVSCGVPQCLVIGPLLWNMFYNNLLELSLPSGVKIIGFADDIAVIGTGYTTELLEMAVNPFLEMITEWMGHNDLWVSVDNHVDAKTRLYSQFYAFKAHNWICVNTCATWVWT